uniref:CHK kinase-like domain-containing protein n=1 Tax=Globodera rostochiensis TaxID=31243 RepID=A0A914H175_GLORO
MAGTYGPRTKKFERQQNKGILNRRVLSVSLISEVIYLNERVLSSTVNRSPTIHCRILIILILFQTGMENKLIKNTNFTIQFVLDKIRASFCESESAEVAHKSTEWLLTNQLEGFEAIDITGGAAFMSTILKVILHWKDPKYGLPSSIVMKIPAPKYTTLVEQKNAIRAKIEAAEEPPRDTFMDEALMEESGTFLIEAHKREIAFYECLPRLDSSLRLPKFYFGSDYSPHHNNGLIIMEDMSTRAVSLPTIPGFNDAHNREWEPPVPMEMRLDFIEGMRSKAEELAKIEPNQIGPLIRKLLPMFTVEYCEMSSYNGAKYGFPACIVHSDLWSPNILWEKDASGRPTDRLCAIIDWQTVHNGNPCTDISRLLALNTFGQYRRDNTDRLLEYYTRKVADHLGGEAPFTTAQLRDAYKHSLPFSMMYLCFGASIYYYMDSVVGQDANERKDKQAELLRRVLMLLEDTIAEFGD